MVEEPRIATELWQKVGAQVGEKGPRVWLERSAARVVELRCRGFYSNGYGAPVPEVLTVPVAYHAIVLRRNLRGPRGEVRDVLPAIEERRPCPPYLCQVGRMTADPPILVSGRAQSRRVGHVVGPAVRGRRDGPILGTNPEDLVERLILGTNLRDLAKEPISGTNPRGLAEKVISGTNLGDLAEEPISDTNPRDFIEEPISSTNPRDLAEKVTSGTNLGDLAEEPISGTNLGDFAEGPISGTNLGDLAEKSISGTNPGYFTEELILGTNPRDLAEKVTSGTNLGDLVEEPISGTNPGDFAEGPISGTNLGDLAEGLLASSVRVISSPGLGGVSQSDPEASSSGASSRPLSLVDSRALRDLEVMKADHDLDTAVTEGSLAVIRERYNIPTEYGLHVS
ncbi:hypothetical protein B296_00001056 [Ensete ventricosum]|uniref:Uncharacterized protein n=1 Tax=Ensete ventricosum TaxID=4639 RepID=A0A427AYC7_ENSVE|nr:hypothetical protein B296_00001056 [Ensete ventricosum]